MCQDLRIHPDGERIAAHHPGAMMRKVAPADSSKAAIDEQYQRRTHQQPQGVKGRAVIFDRRIELGHPQARERDDQPTRNQNPSGSAVPVGIAAAETRGELESAEDAVEGDADDVQHHRQRCGKEPRVVRRDLRTATELDTADRTCDHRDHAERDQPGGDEPCGFDGGGHELEVDAEIEAGFK